MVCLFRDPNLRGILLAILPTPLLEKLEEISQLPLNSQKQQALMGSLLTVAAGKGMRLSQRDDMTRGQDTATQRCERCRARKPKTTNGSSVRHADAEAIPGLRRHHLQGSRPRPA